MADFLTIHTAQGLAAISTAIAAGSEINITHMGVGDGNGNPVLPMENQTALVREKYRGDVNRVYQLPDGSYAAEFVVPSSAGGFTMREVGIYTADGTLFAVGNLPDTYKPAAGSGAFSDAVLRVVFRVSNAAVVNVLVDPNVAVATQQWVINNISVAWILPGGTTGQYLRKKSNGEGDTEWSDALEVTAHVDVVEEHQTLAASQTAVELAECTTRGLALCVDGVRLSNTEWDTHPTDETKLTLATSYPAGTILIAVQNEPTGASGPPLEVHKNLSDVQSASASRWNLGVYSKAEVDERGRTAGDWVATFSPNAPPRTLKANGAQVSRTTYAALYAKIGTAYGAGDGVSTFTLPDARGEFFRGWDDGRGVDVGRWLGSWQGDEMRAHGHNASAAPSGGHAHFVASNGGRSDSTVDGTGVVSVEKTSGGDSGYRLVRSTSATANVGRTSAESDHGHDISIGATGGPETRPRNLAVLICIAY